MTLVNAMIYYFSRFGIPKEVLHDLGADFTSELYSEMCNYFGISQLQCSVSHPQTNTVVERFNGTLKKMLTAFVYENELDWDQGLCYVLFSYRELPIEELGFSHFELTFGKDVKGPLAAVYTTWWEAGENKASCHVVEYLLKQKKFLQDAMNVVVKQRKNLQNEDKVWYDKKAREV